MTRRFPPILVAIIIIAVLLRVAVACYLGDDVPPKQDDYSYVQLAARLAAGQGYTFDRAWYPFTPADTPTAHWSFLYTAFLAGIYALLGVRPLATRLVQAVIGGALLPWATYRLAQRVTRSAAPPGRLNPSQAASPSGASTAGSLDGTSFPWINRISSIVRRMWPARSAAEGSMVPALAAALAAVYAYFILYAARHVTETFYIIALLWSLERALALAEAPTPGKGAVLGLALGAAALLRQSVLPWVPILFLWLAWHLQASSSAERILSFPVHLSSIVRRLSSVIPLIIAILILAACIAPFTIRNYVVYGDFLLLNANAGYAMYSAQHPLHGTSFQEHTAAPLPADLRGKGLNEAQWDRVLMSRGIRFVLQEPVRYVLLSLSRVLDYFQFWPTADSSLLNNVGRAVSFALFLPFMIYGVILTLHRMASTRHPSSILFPRSSVSLLLLFMAFYALLHILTWAMTRYRLPVDAVAIIFAALAIEDLLGRAGARWGIASPGESGIGGPG